MNLYKFRIVSQSNFWLEFDPDHLTKAQCQFILGGTNSILSFKSEPAAYNSEDIITFAQNHGWVYVGQLQLTKTDFKTYLEVYEGHTYPTYPDNHYDLSEKIKKHQEMMFEVFFYLTLGENRQFWIKDDCTVIAFEKIRPRFIMLSADGSKMIVIDSFNLRPDAADQIPEFFKK